MSQVACIPKFLAVYSWLSKNKIDFEHPEIPSVSERRQFEEVAVDLKGLGVLDEEDDMYIAETWHQRVINNMGLLTKSDASQRMP